MTQSAGAAIAVDGLSVEVAGTGTEIVHDASFAIAPGEVLGIVGESGCGKTTVALAVLGGARPGARISSGTVMVHGSPMLGLTRRELQRRRGKDVAYVSQDPAAALNPSLRIGRQLTEMLEVHAPELDKRGISQRVAETMEDVRLPTEQVFLRRYPHQLSGGQQQRVAIAMAAILRPTGIVLDEPTTGLDVITQAHIIRTVLALCAKHNVAMLYVSHDLAVIARVAHRVMVIYAGRVVEAGPVRLLDRPGHPYTTGLIGAVPAISEARILTTIPGRPPSPDRHPPGCRFADRCSFRVDRCDTREPELVPIEVDHVARCYRAIDVRARALTDSVLKIGDAPPAAGTPVLEVNELSAAYGSAKVLESVSFQVAPRECVALVGESGSGKTTVGRCVIGLKTDWAGRVAYHGQALERAARSRSQVVRQRVQIIFQSPYNSLNPRRTIAESVGAPLVEFAELGKRERFARVCEALEQVSLSDRLAQRYPNELSGGERQRVSIARALVCQPEILICDEVTSALDVSVQAAIVDMLADLQAARNLAILFVTHNLALVRSIADRVLVLHSGQIVESGLTSTVLDSPRDAYTRALIAETPVIERRAHVAEPAT
jgi:peptide/nickel transport system ATP-binding protein